MIPVYVLVVELELDRSERSITTFITFLPLHTMIFFLRFFFKNVNRRRKRFSLGHTTYPCRHEAHRTHPEHTKNKRRTNAEHKQDTRRTHTTPRTPRTHAEHTENTARGKKG